ncbi:MAG: bifunctional enoyl-CoA hydratase/phosphate acetyltransferase [Candidatus Eremiobacteraeota bacterium]|nr:bifunctional enoyl-CoA hydratase/phosphate acetyltransferase [Candidatus Eremiobacteraeota bacterium]
MSAPLAGFAALIARARGLRPLRAAVVYPCDALSFAALAEAAKTNLIEPLVIGPSHAIVRAAAEAQSDYLSFARIEAPDAVSAAREAAKLAERGRIDAIVKGSLHSDELLRPIVHARALHPQRRLSHCYVFALRERTEPLILTDAAVNVAPSLEEKAEIVANAIDLARALDLEPRVALLSAVETVTSTIPSTIDAAAIAKMADRHQIVGALVDGPLAFDDAISPEAARRKNIASPVAGRANVLVVPELEAGNMLAKELELLAHEDAAGIVLGASVPIVLTSRADGIGSRVASCALASIYHAWLSSPSRNRGASSGNGKAPSA